MFIFFEAGTEWERARAVLVWCEMRERRSKRIWLVFRRAGPSEEEQDDKSEK
jgi:hypothetical protein